MSTNPLRDPADRRLPRVPEPCALVIFGVTGDLARKKLIPAVYDLANRGLLPPGFVVLGFARRDWGDGDFEQVAKKAAQEHARTPWREDVWQRLAGNMKFVRARSTTTPPSTRSPRPWTSCGDSHGIPRQRRVLPVHPAVAVPDGAASRWSAPGWPTTRTAGGWRRVVVEKPFGHDLESSRELNRLVDEVFTAQDVFRIDHYLGKETVQNLLALRFANTLFEPIWNSHYVDSVQITMAEDVGIGTRAGFYDETGAARDVLQNHLLQLLALTAMEEPVELLRRRDPHREAQGARARSACRATWSSSRSAGSTSRAGSPASGCPATSRRRASRRTRPPRRTRRSGSAWRPGAGPACRSTCAPASGSPAG